MTTESRYAGVLAMRAGQVVLVHEQYPTWDRACWNIPSGRIEAEELPEVGAARELAEETGLVVAPAGLLPVCTVDVHSPTTVTRAWNFRVEVEQSTLGAADPDGLIQDVRWFDLDEAIEQLRRLPHRPLSEPATGILSGAVVPGSHWTYAAADRPPVVVAPHG